MCDQSLYSKYERGERVFPPEYACMLADLYKVGVDYIVYRTNISKLYSHR